MNRVGITSIGLMSRRFAAANLVYYHLQNTWRRIIHAFMEDFIDEFTLYTWIHEFIDLLISFSKDSINLFEEKVAIYTHLTINGFLEDEAPQFCELWLDNVSEVN